MTNSVEHELIDFKELTNNIDTYRSQIISTNEISDESYVRTSSDALVILNFVEQFQKTILENLGSESSLIHFFNEEYMPFSEFISESNILDLAFLDDCLIPEKEKFLFGQDGGISPEILKVHLATMKSWSSKIKVKHDETQEQLKENFSIELRPAAMTCKCINCLTDYRAKLRDAVFFKSKEDIDAAATEITASLAEGITEVNEIYSRMRKLIDKTLHNIRFKLKRSTVNRLTNQVKEYRRQVFNYPSPLAVELTKTIAPVLVDQLVQRDLPEDFLEQAEYDKFFQQISSNIWRNERFVCREFEKFLKSILFLKRKDISSNILKDYLGEFWIHSAARQLNRKIVYHCGPTNSGKTYHAIEALSQADSGCYLAPLRLLAGELYDTLNHKGTITSLLTGEEVVDVAGATHYSSTIEMAKLTQVFDIAVIDEIQMIKDPQRGWAWTRALVNIMAPEVHVCGDPSVLELIKQICDLCGDTLEVRNYERMTELIVEKAPITLGQLQKHDALIVFSRRNALRYKRDLEQLNFKVSIVYGRLSPEVRREQARKFDQGETDIIVSTDAISMGMNLPIKRIVFSTISKFINSQEHIISDSEIKQIAGRAGRYKRFPTGYVTCLQKVDGGVETLRDSIKAKLKQEELCMVGPDLEIFNQVNNALEDNNLQTLKLSEFLRLFYTMTFKKPFFCVQLTEMIEIAEMVEDIDQENRLSTSETFGFACAPVNLGLMEHVQYFVSILNHYVQGSLIKNFKIEHESNDIDYLETNIKCVELYQWLSRHFDGNNFEFDEDEILENKAKAVEKLNELLSQKIERRCSSCGVKIPNEHKFAICDKCFVEGKFRSRRSGPRGGFGKSKTGGKDDKFQGRKKKRKTGNRK